MRFVKKLFVVFLIFILATSFTVSRVSAILLNSEKDGFTFLICGIDDKASNSDTIILADVDKSKNEIRILHVPRDTAVYLDGTPSKINSVFSLAKAKGRSDAEALCALRTFLESAFSISVDASFALTTDSFVKIVDAVGGVEIPISEPLIIESSGYRLVLKKGNNLLCGKDALLFVRHRSSYANADLGRINAQRLFISAILKRLASLNFTDIPSLFRTVGEAVIMDKTLSSLTAAVSLATSLNSFGVTYFTLPGESVPIGGIWYYRIKLYEASSLLRSFGGGVNNSLFI